jgi:O-antigen/teichoic acid export membrane protein
MTAGTAAGQGLALLAAPVLTRLYAPRDFGVLGVFVAIVTLLNVVGTFRYELAVPLPADDRTALDLVAVGLLANVCVVAGLWVLVPFVGDRVERWTATPDLADQLWLLPPTVLATGAYAVLTYWAIRCREYRSIARRNVTYGVAQVGTQLVLGALGVRPLGLLAGTGAGQLAGALALARALRRREGARLRAVSLAGMRAAARRYRRFPLFSTWSGLLNSAGSVAPVLLLAGLHGPTVAGWFTLSTRVVGAPIGLVGEAVAQVYLGEAAELARRDPGGVRRLFGRVSARLFGVGLIPITLLALPAPWWFPAVFGERWHAAGEYAQVLLPMYLLQFAVVPLSQTLNVLEQQHLQLLWDALRLVLAVASLVAARHLGATPVHTVLAYGVAMSLCYAALYAMALSALSAPAARGGPLVPGGTDDARAGQ